MVIEMKRHMTFLLVFLFGLTSNLEGQNSVKTISLPVPDTAGGKPLMQVLKDRHSSRTFSSRNLPPQVLSDILWAAFGVSRSDGRRTAPSARNAQEIRIYAVMADGTYLYDAPTHSLRQTLSADLRSKTGTQDFVATAPLNLVYVADLSKLGARTDDERTLYTGADCGVIAENVYLYCASAGLGVVVRASIDRPACSAAMGLGSSEKIILAQTVGYPPE